MGSFALPFAALGIGMLGSWLFGPKASADNEIMDTGAEEMPRLNQSLRGATMPVIFGTIRVPSHIVWTANWTVIRNETKEDSGGGGKFGGSGMKGPTSGGSTEVTYEYKWDLLFHLGMVPEPYNLIGGWLGEDRLNDATLAAITTGGGNSTIIFGSGTNRSDAAGLEFDDAFFGSGGPANDTGFTNWDHFETTEGTDVRWPWTVYVGFKSLNLGGSARVPQLNWEVGPGDVDMTFNSAYDSSFLRPSGNTWSQGDQSAGYIRSPNDTLFHITSLRSGTERVGSDTWLEVIQISDGSVLDSREGVDIDDDATTAGLDPSSLYVFDVNGQAIVLKQKYIMFLVQDRTVGGAPFQSNYAGILYTVDNAGLLVIEGGFQIRGNDTELWPSIMKCAGLWGEQTDNDPVMMGSMSTVGFDYQIRALPSINQMKSVYIADSGSNEWDSRTVNLNDSGDVGTYWGEHQTYRGDQVLGNNPFGWFLSTATIGIGVTWTSRIYFYVGRADVAKHEDAPGAATANPHINATKAARPNGWIEYYELVWTPGTVTLSLDSATGTFDNDSFVDTSDQALIPFDDAGENIDGTVDTGDDYDPAPTSMIITNPAAAGATLILFSKAFTGSEDLAPTGTYAKVRAFVWNPFTKKAVEYQSIEGSYADTVSDMGSSEGARYDHNHYFFGTWLDEVTNLLHYLWITEDTNSAYSGKDHIGEFGTMDFGGGSIDLLPPFIIHSILTNPALGIGKDVDDIDATSYAAALQFCDSQDIRVSTIYMREDNVLRVIDLLLGTYGGFLHDSAGTIKFGLQDFTASGSVDRIIDNDHLLIESTGEPPVQVMKAARQDGYNKVKVNYLDRALEYRQNHVELEDPVDQDINGIRTKEFPPQFVMSEKTALKIAARGLWNNLYGHDVYRFKLGAKDQDLEPGSVLTLIDSYHHELQGGVQARIMTWRESSRLKFDVEAVREVQYIADSSVDINSATTTSSNQLFGALPEPADFRMYELPKEFSQATAQVFVGWNQWSSAMGAFLYMSPDNVTFKKVSNAQPFIISGQLNHDLIDRDPGYVEQDTELLLMPASGYTVATPTFAQSFTLDNVDGNGRALSQGNIFVGSEMMAFQGLTLLSQNRYKVDKLFRGWGGTHIHGHSSGDYWHKHGGGMFVQDITEDQIGNTVFYKVVPYNFAGQAFNVASVDANSYQVLGTYYRPQNPPQPSVWVASAIGKTSSTDLQGLRYVHVHSSGTNVNVTWPDAARLGGFGVGGFGTGVYGRFTTDNTSHNYRVEVLSNDLTTVVRCLTVDSGFFVYSRDINSTDFNGWQGDLQIRVTPFNDIGDTLRSVSQRVTFFKEA